jgi:hypothetical protein
MSTRNTNDERRPHDDKRTLSWQEIADCYFGGAVSTARRVLGGRVQMIDLNGRKPRAWRDAVEAEILKIAAAQAADPSLVVPRSGGAILKARGIIGNPYGRNGRPADLKAPAAKAKAVRK